MNNHMSDWKRMQFKKNKVWVHTDTSGKPVVKNGKTLIKYQLDQDQEYWVNEKNVTALGDALPSVGIKPQAGPLKKPRSSVAGNSSGATMRKERNTVYIYTDGASSGNPGPSGIGIVLRYEDHEKEISKYIGHSTNNIAELEAIRTGLLEIKNRDIPVKVFTDSNYAYGLLSLGWKAKKNQDLVQAIRELIAKFKHIELIKVRGHAGDKDNERADILATSAIKN